MQTKSLTKESLAKAARYLAARDHDLKAILTAHGPPPMWDRKPGFSTLLQIILEQQVSLASAKSVFARLTAGIVPFTPERFQELGEDHLKLLGLTRQKASYCVHVARAITNQEVRIANLSRMREEEVKIELTRIRGIGSWTADIYLLMALRREDIWPSYDLALATAVAKLKGLRQRPSAKELEQIADSWRPFRAVAARMLWQYYLAERRERGKSSLTTKTLRREETRRISLR